MLVIGGALHTSHVAARLKRAIVKTKNIRVGLQIVAVLEVSQRPVDGVDVLVDVATGLPQVDAAHEDAVADVGDVGEEDRHEGAARDRRRRVLQVARHVGTGGDSSHRGEENRENREESFALVIATMITYSLRSSNLVARPHISHRGVPVVAGETLVVLIRVMMARRMNTILFDNDDEDNDDMEITWARS